MNTILIAIGCSICTTIAIDWIKEYQFRKRMRKAMIARVEQMMREQEQTL